LREEEIKRNRGVIDAPLEENVNDEI